MVSHNSKIKLIFRTIFGDIFDDDFYQKLSTQEVSDSYILKNLSIVPLYKIREQEGVFLHIDKVVVVFEYSNYNRPSFDALLDEICPNLHFSVRDNCLLNFNAICAILNRLLNIAVLSEEKIKDYYNEIYKDKLNTTVFNRYGLKPETLKTIHDMANDPEAKDSLLTGFDQIFPLYNRQTILQLESGLLTVELAIKFS